MEETLKNIETITNEFIEDSEEFINKEKIKIPKFNPKIYENLKITCEGQEILNKEKEMITHPKHYNMGKYEPIDVIRDWKLNFNLGNTVKYIARAEYKNNALEDLKKARFYLDYEIQKREMEENK